VATGAGGAGRRRGPTPRQHGINPATCLGSPRPSAPGRHGGSTWLGRPPCRGSPFPPRCSRLGISCCRLPACVAISARSCPRRCH